MNYDEEKVDDAVLALLWLTSYTERIGGVNMKRTWKGHDFQVLDRLHEAGFIENPVSKAKSLVFTVEGAKRSKELFRRLFCEDQDENDEDAPPRQ